LVLNQLIRRRLQTSFLTHEDIPAKTERVCLVFALLLLHLILKKPIRNLFKNVALGGKLSLYEFGCLMLNLVMEFRAQMFRVSE
jgi:hypothetical protein